MPSLIPFDQSPERILFKLLIDGMITTSDAQAYLSSLDYWRTNYASFPTDTYVGVDGTTTYTGATFGAVSDAIFALNPNAKPYIDYVPTPAAPVT